MVQELQDQPIYRRIAQDLLTSIRTGVLGIGDQLPTEDALCQRYGVSRMTVRQALSELSQGGFITRRRGLGTFVASDKAERVSGRLLGFLEDARAHSLNPHIAIVDQAWIRPGNEDALLLGLTQKSRLRRIRRLRYANDEPIGLNTILLTEAVAAELKDADFTQSFYGLLSMHLGADVELAEQHVEAVSAEGEVASLLTIPPGAPLLKITRVTYLQGGRLVGLTRTFYRGDRYYLSLTIDRESFSKGGESLP